MDIKVVLGHAFGDEGKGVTVQWLCKQAIEQGKSPIVVRFSGGPQAAHTVVNDGIEHICSSFGSGVLLGVPTLFLPTTYIDPICLANERRVLAKKGVDAKIYGYIRRIITPYDVIAGRNDAKVLSDGTCGKGLFPAFKRYKTTQGTMPSIGRCLDDSAGFHKIERVPKLDKVFNDSLNELLSICDDGFKLSDFDVFIFEGTQGLLLDMDCGFYPHVTPSKVGLNGIPEKYLDNAEVYLVTRTYLTRHGNGYEPRYPHDYDLSDKHETNVYNDYQGTFKTGVLDIDILNRAHDRHCIDNYVAMHKLKINLVVTHMDVVKGKFDYVLNGRKFRLDDATPKSVCDTIRANLVYDPINIFYNDSIESKLIQI